MPSFKPYHTRELCLDNGVEDNSPLALHCDDDLPWTGAGYASTASSDDDTASDDYSPASSVSSRASSTSSSSSSGLEEAACTTPSAQKTQYRETPGRRSNHHAHWRLRHVRPAAAPTTTMTTTLLPSSRRPYSRLPTALLLSTRAIYHESRALPFSASEFVFQSWFASGLISAANFFTTRLVADWQRDAARWVRIEVLSKDLASPGERAGSGLHKKPLSSTSEWV